MLSVLDSVQSIHLWRRSTKFSKWREYEWKYSIIWIIFLQIENIAEQRTMYREHHYAGCWLTILMHIIVIIIMLVAGFNQFRFRNAKLLKTGLHLWSKLAPCASLNNYPISSMRTVVGYHIKSKSWSSLWTNSILKK